jgi:hypothetical protein
MLNYNLRFGIFNNFLSFTCPKYVQDPCSARQDGVTLHEAILALRKLHQLWHGAAAAATQKGPAAAAACRPIGPRPCSFGLSATSQQYFSLRTNQPPATSQQYFSLRTNQHQPSA